MEFVPKPLNANRPYFHRKFTESSETGVGLCDTRTRINNGNIYYLWMINFSVIRSCQESNLSILTTELSNIFTYCSSLCRQWYQYYAFWSNRKGTTFCFYAKSIQPNTYRFQLQLELQLQQKTSISKETIK